MGSKLAVRRKLIILALVGAILTVTLSGCSWFQPKEQAPIYNFTYSESDEDWSAVAARVLGSCVKVTAGENPGHITSAGSGMVISSDADGVYILTNSHVVTERGNSDRVYTSVNVTFFDGVSNTALAVKRSSSLDKSTDLALLKVPLTAAAQYPAVTLNTSAPVYGQPVLAAGNGQNLGLAFSEGIVGNPSVTLGGSNSSVTSPLIMFTAGVNPGNSGGPVFDRAGNLIGISTLKAVADTAKGAGAGADNVDIYADNISFALPVYNIETFLAGGIALRYSAYDAAADYYAGLAANALSSCVEIWSSSGAESYAGSGVIVAANAKKKETYILTNSHVIAGSGGVRSQIGVRFFNDDKTYAAAAVKYSGGDRSTDLALLRVGVYDAKNGVAAAAAGGVSFAQAVVAIGNGMNLGTAVSKGVISHPDIFINGGGDDTPSCRMIGFTAPINPGNSGGPLFDLRGRLIGINTLKPVEDIACGTDDSVVNITADNVAFALPIANIAAFLAGANWEYTLQII
jgi:S1-C subfamily serine protease